MFYTHFQNARYKKTVNVKKKKILRVREVESWCIDKKVNAGKRKGWIDDIQKSSGLNVSLYIK